jgi:NAD(P)-dependent dehydrogenase (short-subunit alcohol dehydrogenase family)
VDTYRFDGRVAVVTGAGRGIGQAYARLLAERGAQVVVNDVDDAPAREVAQEIDGIADVHDVSTVEGAQALITRALATFGRIDALINNAGIIRWAGPPDVDAQNLDAHLAVHVGGAFNTAIAAWPHMVEQTYGRIVMTTSTGMFGLPTNVSYATAKAGVIGLTRSLAIAGERHGIKVNAIAPAAFTRIAGPPTDTSDQMPPEHVAPMAAFLAHEGCPVSGEIYAAGAGRFARLFVACTEGRVLPDPSIEAVAQHWDAINDVQEYSIPADLMHWSETFMAHLEPDSR